MLLKSIHIFIDLLKEKEESQETVQGIVRGTTTDTETMIEIGTGTGDLTADPDPVKDLAHPSPKSSTMKDQ